MKKSFLGDERGLGKKTLLAVILLVIIAAGGAYWQFGRSDAPTKSTSNKAVSSAVSDECNKLYGDKDFCKFASNFSLSGNSYKFVSSSTKGTSGSSEMITMLNDGKGNTSMSMTSAGSQTDFIRLNGVTYMKEADSGVWLKYGTSTPSSVIPPNPTRDISFDTKLPAGATEPTTSFKKLGTEACGKLTCFKYQVIDPSQTGTSYVWFDTKDYRLQHMSNTDADGTTSDSTITYQPITISEPSPVQDMPSASSTPATP